MNKLHFSKEKIDMEYKVVKIEGLTIFCGKNNIGKILFTKYVLSEIKPPDELRIFEYPENSLHPELQIEKATYDGARQEAVEALKAIAQGVSRTANIVKEMPDEMINKMGGKENVWKAYEDETFYTSTI